LTIVACQLKSLKLKNEVKEEEYNEMMRLKWEKEIVENSEKQTVHYQDIRYNGNPYFDLS
jgi:hypothetical protein